MRFYSRDTPLYHNTIFLAQDEVDEAGPSGLTASSNTNTSKSRPFVLTREELERRQDDNSACYSFMQREGLMERLLGHKMLTGRVDSHVVLGFLPLDPKDNLPSKNHNNVSYMTFISRT